LTTREIKNLFNSIFFLVKVSVGQEISKSDIVKFKIKSVTTIDGNGDINTTSKYYYNDKTI
jgi:hypothetical protein